jgi:hypothetical protein
LGFSWLGESMAKGQREGTARRPRLKEGDVFVFDVGTENVAAGQVLMKNTAGFNLYAIFFKPLWPRDGPLDVREIVGSEIFLAGGTMDALIYHGRWRLIGNQKADLAQIPLPRFKVMIDGRDVVEDFFGRKIRDACSADLRYYQNRCARSPITFEDAIKAFHDKGQSPPEELTLQNAVALSKDPLESA